MRGRSHRVRTNQNPVRGRRVIAGLVLGAAVSACSLFADLQGLSSTGNASDAGSPSSDVTSGLADSDGPRPEGGSDAGDVSASATAYAKAVLSDAPLAWYRSDETAGPAAVDSVGGPSGTYSTKGLTFDHPGATPGGRAVYLDGAQGRIEIGRRFPFEGTVPFTVELWVKAEVLDDKVRRILSRAPVGDMNVGYVIQANPGDFLFQRIGDGGVSTYASGPLPAVNAWTHLVATYDDEVTIFYMNGVETGRSNSKGVLYDDPTAILVVGDLPGGQFFKWRGLVDELAFYDKVLSPARVSAHHAAATEP